MCLVKDGVDNPVLFASSTLLAAEKNYTPIGKKALTLTFVVKEFYKYVDGGNFKLITNHQPLKMIRKNIFQH